MIHTLPLETLRLMLRPLQIGDTPTVQRLLNDRYLADSMIGVPHPYTRRNAEAYITWCREALIEGRSFSLAVVPKDRAAGENGDTLAGCVTLRLFREHRRGELGYWMGEPYRRQGYAFEAARRMVQFGFGMLKLNRIYALCFTDNAGSVRILEKLGMGREGVWRQDVRKEMGFKDVAIYGLLRREFK